MASTDSGFLTRAFLGSAVAYGILGIAIGLAMAIEHDHGQRATHAHINLIGFVSFFLFALFHKQWGGAVSRRLALAHFWLAQAGMLGLAVGLWMYHGGDVVFEIVAAFFAIIYAISFLVFAVLAWPVVKNGA